MTPEEEIASVLAKPERAFAYAPRASEIVALLRSRPDLWAACAPDRSCIQGDVLAHYDDGSKVAWASCSGGAHKLGEWGWLQLAFTDASGVQTTRDYVALDKWALGAPEGMAAVPREATEKMLSAGHSLFGSDYVVARRHQGIGLVVAMGGPTCATIWTAMIAAAESGGE